MSVTLMESFANGKKFRRSDKVKDQIYRFLKIEALRYALVEAWCTPL